MSGIPGLGGGGDAPNVSDLNEAWGVGPAADEGSGSADSPQADGGGATATVSSEGAIRSSRFAGDLLQGLLDEYCPAPGETGIGTDETAPPGPPTYDDLKAKAEKGELTSADIQASNLKPAELAELVKGMAKSESLVVKDNLRDLMASDGFAPILARAFDGMTSPAEALQVLRSVGLDSANASTQVQATFNAALDGMRDGSLRTQILRDGLAGDNGAIAQAALNYLGSRESLPADFLKAMAKDTSVDAAKLATIVERMGEAGSLTTAMKTLSKQPEEQVWDVFRRLGEASLAREGKEGPQIREQFEKALDQLPTDERAELLWKAIDDPRGYKSNDAQPNAAHKFLAEYLTRAGGGVREVERMIDTLDDDGAHDFREFIRDHVTGQQHKQLKRLGDSAEGWEEPGDIDHELLEEAKGALTDGGEASDIAKMNDATLEAYLETWELDWDDVPVPQVMAARVAEIGTPEARARFISLIAAGGPAYLDANKDTQCEMILKALGDNPNEVLREMGPAALKEMAKLFMVTDPPLLDKLFQAMTFTDDDGNRRSSLSAENAARLVRAMNSAAPEATAYLGTGSWVGDLIKGVQIEGGYEAGVEKDGVSAKKSVSVSFSPGPLVDGERDRDVNRAASAIESFMQEYVDVLDGMSQNEKQILKEELARTERPR